MQERWTKATPETPRPTDTEKATFFALPPSATPTSELTQSATFLNSTMATPRAINRDEWRREVERAAYRLAELRGFAPGREKEDWIQAEAQFNEYLSRQGIRVLE